MKPNKTYNCDTAAGNSNLNVHTREKPASGDVTSNQK